LPRFFLFQTNENMYDDDDILERRSLDKVLHTTFFLRIASFYQGKALNATTKICKRISLNLKGFLSE